MTTDDLTVIDKKVDELIKDKTQYSFEELKIKVENILKSVNIFLVDNQVENKALDLYLKTVITKRNDILKQKEKSKIDNSKQTKYQLIETICKAYEFETQEELIKKIEILEKKTNFELSKILKELE